MILMSTNTKPIELHGTIINIVFPKNGDPIDYSVGQLSINSNGEFATFAGLTGRIRINDKVIMSGRWINHERYGKQFKVESCKPDMSIESGGLAVYLANNKEIKGLGSAKAKKLVELYKETLEYECRENPDKVAAAIGVKPKTIESLLEVLTQDQLLLETKTWLSEIGLTIKQIDKIVDQYGWDTKRILDENPYLLIGDISGFGFRRADEIALKIGVHKEHEGRIRAGILYTINQELENGHCFMEYHDLIKRSNKTLALDCLDAKEKIAAAIEALIQKEKIVKREAENVVAIALPSIYQAESYLIEKIREICKDENPYKYYFNPGDSAKYMELNDEQRRGVECALHNKIMILSGGAGTGKTFTIRTIAQIYEDYGLSVAFAAPTGKAARRIDEATGFPAQTIHRFLEYRPRVDEKELGGGFQIDENNPIEANVVIIDESSMLDIRLAYALFKGIDFNHTALVLVGDHNQLPPVGPGHFFRDLYENECIHKVTLKDVVRQAGVLKHSCLQILDGSVPDTPKKSHEGEALPWYKIDNNHLGTNANDPDELRKSLLHYLVLIPDKLGFSLLNDVQVLTPVNSKGPLSAQELNREIQKIVQRKIYQVEVKDSTTESARKRIDILFGDRVIQTKNDYNLGARGGVFNGTLGIVRRKDKDGSIFVEFDDGQSVHIKGESLKNISLAYALTVHKSQGSEFPCVISICHSQHSFMQNRNLLYTSATRAKTCSIIIGNKLGIRRACECIDANRRRTFLGIKDEFFQ